jgi:ParB family chromosome partitioning protein
MKLELHQLDRRYEHLRARNRKQQQRVLASIAATGQQTPIIVVPVPEQANRYQVIDGYKRIAAIQQLGRDTVHAVVWEMSEADALVLEHAIRSGQRDTAIEEGWLLSELEQRFGYSLQDLAARLDRSVSWVSRRLALVEVLPETVQQRVRDGEIAAHVAMKYLVPVARGNRADCERMAEAFAKHGFSTRQAGEIYAAWREASSSIRQRILEAPELFLKARHEVEPEPASAAEDLMRDLTMIVAITNRASRRLARASPEMSANAFASAQRKIESALRDLTGLSERIDKEQGHVDAKPTRHDSGTSPAGRLETPDRPPLERLALERTERVALEVLPVAPDSTNRERTGPPATDSGVVGLMQRQSGSGP